MSIYVFSLLVGYRRSGVDVAQGVRNRFLRKTNQQIRYIFTEIPTEHYIQVYQSLGIEPEQMLCAHSFMTGRDHLGGSSRVSDVLERLQERFEIDETVQTESEIRLYKDNSQKISIRLKENPKYFSEIMYFDFGRLLAVEYYTDRLLFTHFYETVSDEKGSRARLARTTFSDEQGQRVFDCIYDNEEKKSYVFPDGSCYTHAQFMELFIQKLQLSSEDIVLIDRPSQLDFVEPLFTYGHQAKLIPFIHSGHYFEKGEEPSAVYMNYEYYYWFKYSHYIHCMVVSTEEQKKELIEKLEEYGCHVPKIEVIPVSGLEELKYPKGPRRRYSVLSVSRLDPRKKIDMLIRSVAEAHKSIPEITLDIYGEGADVYVSEYKQLVKDLQAEDYIRFMGLCDVREVYQDYELYVTASLWETLGLSVMEAVGAGDAVVGLDVRYGNRLFVKQGVNGQLVDFSLKDINEPKKEQETVCKMAEAIVDMLSDQERLQSYSEESYRIAKQYLNDTIGEKWIWFITLI